MNEIKLKGIAESISTEYDDAMKEFVYEIIVREPILKDKQKVRFVSREQNETLENFKIGSMIYVKGKLGLPAQTIGAFNIHWTWVGYTRNLKMNSVKNQFKADTPKMKQFKNTLKTLGFDNDQIKYGTKSFDEKIEIEESIENAITSISTRKQKKSKTLKP